MTGQRVFIIALMACFCVALPVTDLVVPEAKDAGTSGAEFVQSTLKSGGINVGQLTNDFTKDGLNGGLEDLESEAADGQTTPNTPLTLDTTELDEHPTSFINVEDYPTKMCSNVEARKAGPSSGGNSVVYKRTKQIFADYDAQLAPLCLDAATNSDAIIAATMDMQKAVKDATLNLSSGPDSTSEDINALLNIRQLPSSLITKKEEEAMKKYCKHGTYSSDIQNLKDEPILAKLEKGVAEFDKCMDCMCKHGQAHCALTPICLKSIEDLTDVAGDLSKAKGFKDENGELIEELGPKHLEAVHKIIQHVSKKKKQLHARHGATPTKEQFHQVFSENDLVAETLVQVRGCHGMSAATAVEFKAGAISCGFDCNSYADVSEASISCSAFDVITVEIGVIFEPLTMFLKLKLCAPGVSDVIGEIQKIPHVNEILSEFGLDGGCLLLGIGYIDFTNGIAEIKPGKNGLLSYDFWHVVKASISARAFFRWDSMLPESNPYSHDCHRNEFQPRQKSTAECNNIMLSMSSIRLKGHAAECRDYMLASTSITGCCNNCMILEPYAHRAEDWFGVKAFAELQVFNPAACFESGCYETVWKQDFFKEAWKTGDWRDPPPPPPPPPRHAQGSVRAQYGATVTAGKAFVPDVRFNSEWFPICGHFFWNNNDGATTVCQGLGFSSGTCQRAGNTYSIDSMPVGSCRPGQALNSCNDGQWGGNGWGNLEYGGGFCKGGHGPGITVTCYYEPTWVKGVNGANCDDTCSALDKTCDTSYMDALTTADLVTAAFAEAGYTCINVGGSRNYPGSPFSSAQTGYCYFTTPGSNVVSNGNSYGHHAALCSCVSAPVDTTPTLVDGSVRAENGATATAGVAFVPEVMFNGNWYPICGHFFWDNNHGATTVCQELGYGGFSSGTRQHVRDTYSADSMPVGECSAGQALTSCNQGGNDWGNLEYNGGWCKAGTQIGVTVTCN